MDSKIIYLFLKYINDECSSEELEEVIAILKNGRYPGEWEAALNEDAEAFLGDTKEGDLSKQEISSLYARIERDLPGHRAPKRIIPLWLRYAAAASVILGMSIGGYFLLQKQPAQQTAQKQDIAPGRNQATLTLANGQKITLTKNLSGRLAQQGNTSIQITAGAIAYNAGRPENKTEYNTLTTQRGEVSPYPLVLPDGTKVWLNAASSITFPTAFNAKTRTVSVTGEAYLEVAHNPKQPFSVKTATQTIEDIGTAFDVNAYTDEPDAKTTLVSGSVRVNQTLLKPGEQSITAKNSIVVQPADIQDVTAWRNGNFHFTDARLSDILRQASRWYDVDITYENESLKDKKFGAITTRFAKASQLLHMLELTGEVKFKIAGKQITVLNK